MFGFFKEVSNCFSQFQDFDFTEFFAYPSLLTYYWNDWLMVMVVIVVMFSKDMLAFLILQLFLMKPSFILNMMAICSVLMYKYCRHGWPSLFSLHLSFVYEEKLCLFYYYWMRKFYFDHSNGLTSSKWHQFLLV